MWRTLRGQLVGQEGLFCPQGLCGEFGVRISQSIVQTLYFNTAELPQHWTLAEIDVAITANIRSYQDFVISKSNGVHSKNVFVLE